MNCECLIHPFQNDPGTSQSQRIMDVLLSDAVKIDARTMADLLNYFVQISRHINYYDPELNVSDWQPFFRQSTPFVLTSIIKFPLKNTEDNLKLYKTIFESKPSPAGLQLLSYSLFHRFIKNINRWHIDLNESLLPIAAILDNLIRIKLQSTVRQFIILSNTASKHYGIRNIDFTKISSNPVWGLDSDSLSATDKTFLVPGISSHQRMLDLYSNLNTLMIVFLDVVTSLSTAAESNLEQSFTPLRDELLKRQPPHLALLFAFLNIFRQLQSNLNEYTRKHLDYFYKEILHFKPEGAVPDRANILIEIQNSLKSYLLKKGLKVKDGKDDNRQDILFELDDEIVVNQTKIGDKRTLFVNNRNAYAKTCVEGVYMAPVAEMADGVEKEFADDPKNFPTLGSKYSKYSDPETRLFKTYPNARIGFVLASPVLLLQAGSTRTITIDIPCLLKDPICSGIRMFPGDNTKGCCGGNENGGNDPDMIPYPDFFGTDNFYNLVNNAIKATWYLISEDIIREALNKGISANLAALLRDLALTEKEDPLCYCPGNRRKLEAILNENEFTALKNHMSPEEKLVIDELIKPRHAFSFLFSGEEEWIEPSAVANMEMDNTNLPAGEFLLKITLILRPDKGAVTFFSREVLAEDLGTTLPLLKVQLDDKIKLTKIDFKKLAHKKELEGDCCLLKDEDGGDISLYHFFRNVIIKNTDDDIIKVEVCGLKNFIVQNDESLLDVNSPMMAFGARPKINSNFYIGSEEIFLKNWTNLWINIKWKDLPDNLEDYYVGYQNQFWDAASSTWKEEGRITKNNFLALFSLLEDGTWYLKPGDPATTCSIDGGVYNKLFPDPPFEYKFCFGNDFNNFFSSYTHQFHLTRGDFKDIPDHPLEKHSYEGIKKKDVNSRCCFIRLTLKCQDFQHERYPFVLARQMAAVGKLPDLIAGAVYFNIDPLTGGYQVLNLQEVFNDIKNSFFISDNTNTEIKNIQIESLAPLNTPAGHHPINNTEKINFIKNIINNDIDVNFMPPPNPNPRHYDTLNDAVSDLHGLLGSLNAKVDKFANSGAVIPNEPYTPTISNITLDYTAFASIKDIDLIHLYPYQGTYQQVEIELQPSLFPTHCDEGTLFLGLSNLVPGNNLNLLFQMAEATSDSESDKESVYWHYLESNVWKSLRPGFEVLDDATNNLTGSGIIKLALPANMTNENTIMPAGLHWIKATIPKNSGAVSETIGIHPHAIHVVFTNEEANNKLRLSKSLQAGSISKLETADASVKSVSQPYESFGGLVPEIEQQFYVRVSETLRHKGRAIQSFDYERLVLQRFPQLFKVKCINHSFGLNAHEYINDFPYAGGYVLMVVIPDLNKLKAGNSFEPKAPVSLLEDINEFIRQRTSPFVRFRAMNPRYEQVAFCLKIRLQKNKDENFYKEQVREDIRTFLAPWAVGDYYKLTFGQCVYRSDIIQFLETRDYIDFIEDLRMGGKDKPDDKLPKICPDTPRSILIAGDIEVCIIPPKCEDWGDYYPCSEEQLVQPCDTRPKLISDYCKKRKFTI